MRLPLTREETLATFERFRAAPGSAFMESHFLDYLLADPREKGAVRNSFRGLTRFNKFIDSIEHEYGICFSQADLETGFSVDAFVDRANALQSSRSGSLASLRNRERAGAGWGPVVILDFVLICIGVGLRRHLAIAATATVLAVTLTIAFSVFAVRSRRELARLRDRIESDPPLPLPDNSLQRDRYG